MLKKVARVQQNFILFGELEGEIERFKIGKDDTSFYIQRKVLKMQEVKEFHKMNDNIIVDPSLDTKYKGKELFPEKLERTKNHFEGRDIHAEIKKALKKERITKL